MSFRLKTLYKISSHPLTRKSPLAALKRYFLFHLSQRLFPYTQVYPWIGELRLFVRKGWAGVVGNIYTGLYDFEEMSFILHYLKKDDLFADIGANHGVYSLLAAGICQAQVISIEPIPETFKQLNEQIHLNKLENLIKTHQAGISSKPGQLYFSKQLGTMNHVVLDPHSPTDVLEVPVFTLDQLITGPAKVLKIDTEGFELPALQGALNCLSNPALHAIIIELNGSGEKYGYTDQTTDQLLRSQGFAPYRYLPFERQLEPLKDWRKDQYNTLYIRHPENVLPVLQQTPKIQLLNQAI
ncbi:FkbM family methyltransferase [bacterium (Candidatus Blackallbacteria) CG17_big_fil_post_rev_8_21_14_2_50_48_46]|uniref:FkbM family methyltransferase n=1 Tax=bacterium (Candidatus Blackallbacteria) CG17_big_fil_post_rev_8_21_14_2_50_48_46 TaxID=2014261 RepID=A0A2M7G6R7_9BACT|nr:MAG: FkbM family methyltransferase [bacterium (Candidatus Blackallbacteria) CG18_big_fil_WC_8_21_14_2_50_49_26]PIW17718.1 MAG: FkbM family methyltransferase [bacterium (Candidatus Blackallbacteria) CG17_big_fil_post_rev_8_21_14_2_50_48_46]PIW47534.1 MAG: FkbM family methyltransferase [bacterium (Candidatus Blackallbacteria) CG13_big_fil_rev_8_21_14_2_50_49_14]